MSREGTSPSIDMFVEILINAGKAGLSIEWRDRYSRSLIEAELAMRGYSLCEQIKTEGRRFSGVPKLSQENGADLLMRVRHLLWLWDPADARDSKHRLEQMCKILDIKPESKS